MICIIFNNFFYILYSLDNEDRQQALLGISPQSDKRSYQIIMENIVSSRD